MKEAGEHGAYEQGGEGAGIEVASADAARGAAAAMTPPTSANAEASSPPCANNAAQTTRLAAINNASKLSAHCCSGAVRVFQKWSRASFEQLRRAKLARLLAESRKGRVTLGRQIREKGP